MFRASASLSCHTPPYWNTCCGSMIEWTVWAQRRPCMTDPSPRLLPPMSCATAHWTGRLSGCAAPWRTARRLRPPPFGSGRPLRGAGGGGGRGGGRGGAVGADRHRRVGRASVPGQMGKCRSLALIVNSPRLAGGRVTRRGGCHQGIVVSAVTTNCWVTRK